MVVAPIMLAGCKSRQGAGRTITTDGHEGLRRSMTKRMEQADSKAIYKRRKVIVEPVFGHIKNGGFRRFSVRGKDKVAGEFSLVWRGTQYEKNGARNHDGISVSGIWKYVVPMGLKQEKTGKNRI